MKRRFLKFQLVSSSTGQDGEKHTPSLGRRWFWWSVAVAVVAGIIILVVERYGL